MSAGSSGVKQRLESEERFNICQKIRLEFNSPKGIHRQLLVGADKRATKNYDLGFDAPIADLNKEDAFWVFNESKFVIQGVNNFNKLNTFILRR